MAGGPESIRREATGGGPHNKHSHTSAQSPEEDERGPIERVCPSRPRGAGIGRQQRSSSRIVLVKHSQLRLPQGLAFAESLLPEVPVELLHQDLRRGVVDFPQAGDAGFSPGELKRPLQAQHTLSARCLAEGRFARGKNNELDPAQIEFRDFQGREDSIVDIRSPCGICTSEDDSERRQGSNPTAASMSSSEIAAAPGFWSARSEANRGVSAAKKPCVAR